MSNKEDFTQMSEGIDKARDLINQNPLMNIEVTKLQVFLKVLTKVIKMRSLED